MHNPPFCVDGYEFDNTESNLAGDGQFGPFRIFVPDQQDYIMGVYESRVHAQIVADLLIAAAQRQAA